MKKHLAVLFAIIGAMSMPLRAQQTESGVDAAKVINTLKERITLGGIVQAGYTYDEGQNVDNEFDIKRIIFTANGQIADNWRVYFMYNFKNSALQELYTEYKVAPELAFTLGQFKIPYSIEAQVGTAVAELISRYSQATNYLAAVTGSDKLLGAQARRDIGFMVSGDLFKSYVNYSIGIFNGQGINTKDKNSNKDIMGRLMFNPVKCFSFGGSFAKGKGNAIAVSEYNTIAIGENYRRDRWSGGFVLKTQRANLRAEYLGGKDGKVKSEGYYATADIHLVPKKFDFIASYDFLNKNKDMGAKQTNYVAGVQYWFYPKCRLQAQYTFCDKKLEKNANMIQTQIQIAF